MINHVRVVCCPLLICLCETGNICFAVQRQCCVANASRFKTRTNIVRSLRCILGITEYMRVDFSTKSIFKILLYALGNRNFEARIRSVNRFFASRTLSENHFLTYKKSTTKALSPFRLPRKCSKVFLVNFYGTERFETPLTAPHLLELLNDLNCTTTGLALTCNFPPIEF